MSRNHSKSWKIQSNDSPGDSESLLRIGTQFQLANGYMGYRGTLDEFRAQHFPANTLAGIYDQVGDAWREPVNAPNAAYTRVKIDGKELHPLELADNVISHQQTLNMQEAVFERTTSFDIDGNEITISSRRFLSIVEPHLLCLEYTILSKEACVVEITTGIDCKIWDLNGPHLKRFKTHPSDNPILTLSCVTHEKEDTVVLSESLQHDPVDDTTKVSDKATLYGRRFEVSLNAGEKWKCCKFVSILKSGDTEGSLISRSIQVSSHAQEMGFEDCLKEQREAWSERWESAEIQIDGDAQANQALRYSIFQLLMVAPVPGSSNSIPARALSGQVYKGAIFWDTEFFMFPFFLHTQPAVAEDLLRYRIQTLAGAKLKAQSEGTGFKGAFYAWESQESGHEACTYFNVGDPFTGRDLRTHFRDKQIHISGDVALAFWDHYQHTGSAHLLKEGGAEVILECARFYASWIYYKPDKNRYEVLDVIGPDEYHERVNNNAFTNQIVHATFEIAIAVIKALNTLDPAFTERLLDKLNIRNDLNLFEEILSKLYLPQPDSANDRIEQFDGYFKLEDVSLKTVLSRKKLPNEYLGAGQGVAAHTQIIKQADVVMMLHRFRSKFSTSVKKQNWEYYEPRTEHGSSLSACAYAMVACECGWEDRAYPYFLKTAKVDLDANYKMYAGTTFIGGSHPAANGGSWMTVVFGFAGLQTFKDYIEVNPRLPKSWNHLQFKIHHESGFYQFGITPNAVTITPLAEKPKRFEFRVHREVIQIENKPITIQI